MSADIEKLVLEGRKKLLVSNVSSVDGFGEQFIKITINQTKVLISGEKLKVVSYNQENGNFIAEGIINEIKYSAEYNANIGKKSSGILLSK